MLDTERSTADTPPVRHELGGIVYLNFFERFFTTVRPSSYFEIGVSMGNSLRHARCASVAVDPRIKAEGTDFIGEKPALHLFQMKSDDFFATYDLRNFLPQGVDAAFLDRKSPNSNPACATSSTRRITSTGTRGHAPRTPCRSRPR